LFDQNSNGTIEQEEFHSIRILLQGFNQYKHNLFHENLRHIFGNRTNRISFAGKNIQKRKKKIRNFYLEFYNFVKLGYLRQLLMS